MERIICACMGVTERDIRAFFEQPQASIDSFVDKTGVTTVCTSCKLDVDLVLESIRVQDRVATARQVEAAEEVVSGNVARDVIDSGFLVNKDGIKTVLRIDNAVNVFDPESSKRLTDYRWNVRVLDESGALRAKRSGYLPIGEALTLDLTELPGCPGLGWFWVWLEPKTGGYFGATRPQYALVGPGWVSTVHTQPHAMACRAKTVIIQAPQNKFRTLVSVVNGTNKPANCTFVLNSTTSPLDETRIVPIAKNGSRLVDIDEEFSDAGRKMDVAVLVVKSDEPVRKHVLKVQPNGHYSIDHFPDAK